MPHIAAKMWPGHTEEEKKAFAAAVVDAAVKHLNVPAGWVSVGIEEVAPERWDEDVFRPEILGKKDTLYARSLQLKDDD